MPTKTRTNVGTKGLQRGVHHAATKARASKKESNTQDLRSVLGMKLQEMHDVEVQIVKTLPKLLKKAKDPDLQEAMAHHLKQTEGHVARAEEACGILGIKPQKGKSAAIRGLAEDTDTALAQSGPGDELTDAVLSAALRAVEHYEIAAYGAMREWAELIGERQISELLEETLHEEEETADALTDLALSKLNAKAAGDPEGTVSSIFMGSAVVRASADGNDGAQKDQEKKRADGKEDENIPDEDEDESDEEEDDEEEDDDDEEEG